MCDAATMFGALQDRVLVRVASCACDGDAAWYIADTSG